MTDESRDDLRPASPADADAGRNADGSDEIMRWNGFAAAAAAAGLTD